MARYEGQCVKCGRSVKDGHDSYGALTICPRCHADKCEECRDIMIGLVRNAIQSWYRDPSPSTSLAEAIGKVVWKSKE